jgi:hypothetical protein
MIIINIAKEFSRYPAGRILSDGPHSGERFRNDFLVGNIENNKPFVIEFDGARGYGSSFLEEAFGGLIRNGMSKEKVLKLITFSSSDPTLEIEIKEYIDEAKS